MGRNGHAGIPRPAWERLLRDSFEENEWRRGFRLRGGKAFQTQLVQLAVARGESRKV